MNHLDNFGTNLTSGTSASDTTSPVNSVPSIAAPFWVAFDATNINNHYETKLITSKTATNILHSALLYDHTTAEEIRIVNPAAEFDALSTGWQTGPGTWTYSSADSPTFVLTTSVDLSSFIGVGARIKLTQTTVKYFIVTAISGTTITLYGGTDYTLTAAAITSPYFSIMKAPVGFPLQKEKWTTKATYTSDTTQSSPVSGTWYNVGTFLLNVPIGSWDLGYSASYRLNDTATAAYAFFSTLSTGNNTESDTELSFVLDGLGGAIGYSSSHASRRKPGGVTVAVKTPYYLNAKVQDTGVDSFILRGVSFPCVIDAVCAYL